MSELKQRYCVLAKTGGPYLRTSFLRGTEQFLRDIAADPVFVKAMVERKEMHVRIDDLAELGAKGIIVSQISTCRI